MPAIDEALRKFHVSLTVAHLDRSTAFYRTLFGTEPAKLRTDYAKFELAEPALVLSLIPGTPGRNGALNHVGLRVRTSDELVEIQRRLEAAGLATRREDGVECCHAIQTKFWIADPDRTLWEIYVFHDDVDDAATVPDHAAGPTVPASGASQVWEHRLGEPIPASIPADDNSLHEIQCEGTINGFPDAPNRRNLLVDACRALRPGGTLSVHGLSGDRASRSTPSLPGPAAAVQFVPATGDVVDEVARAGFVEVRLETLSDRAYFEVDGVPMRELRLSARKPGHRPRAVTHQAIYLGPMAEVKDDFGNVFRRGVATDLNVHDWQLLSRSAMGAAFLLLPPAGAKVDLLRVGRPSPPTPRSG